MSVNVPGKPPRDPGTDTSRREEGAGPPYRPLPPPDLLAKHGARLLDPLTAVRLPGRPAPTSTAYVVDRILVAGGPAGQAAFDLLQQAAAEAGLRVAVDERSTALAARRDDPAYERTPRAVTLVLDAARDATLPVLPPDAWSVLTRARGLAAGDLAIERALGLEHVLMGTDPDLGGSPFTEGHGTSGVPFTEGHGTSGYGRPGSGGRQPVTWPGLPPVRKPDEVLGVRRPVVAVLDTGCGDHPWLGEPVVRRDEQQPGVVPAGRTDPATDPERTGDVTGPLDAALDSHSGHGTFICGLVHQLCPDADILAVRVMGSDGVVLEGELMDALLELETRLDEGDPAQRIDILVLSLGYYHEEPDDHLFDSPLLTSLTALGARGVAVVAAAGNGATTEPMYPAAFTPYAEGLVPLAVPGVVPVTSVAATNPDGTVALFSNAGSWVTCWHPGAALVSTMPPAFRGGAQPSVSYTAPDGTRRASLDPDDFTSGFGVWSGTSFAAPMMAGLLARRWLDSAPEWARANAGAPATADQVAALVAELVAKYGRPGGGPP